MPLEDITNPARINIKSLVIEEPQVRKAQLLFDPEKDIPENVWQDLGKIVGNELHQFENDEMYWEPYLEAATNIALLSSNRKNILHFDEAVGYGLTDAIRDGISPLAVRWTESERTIMALGRVAIIDSPSRRLFNRIIGNLEIDDSWEAIGEGIKEARADVFENWEEENDKLFRLLEIGAAAKTCSPERFEEIGSYFDTELFGLIQENINRAKNEFQQNEETVFIRQQAALLSFARILYPDGFKVIQPDPEDWNRFHQTLETLAQLKQWKDYLKFAVDLKILTAEELRFSEEKGLEIILPDPNKSAYSESVPPLPKVRKF